MLECRGVSASYGRHQAIDDVAIRVAPGEIVVILGANGAGKTTLLNAIAGLVPASGEVTLDGRSLRGLPPHLIVEAGLALVPEGRRVFGDLTVHENLALGAYARRARQSEREHLDRVLALFPKLAERGRQVARTMSGGEQQMVAIARAMMSSPTILMLDEPSLGLSPLLCSELFKALAQVRKTGAGILLVEQNARQALAIADRGYLLENGRIVGDGPAASLAQDAAVQKAYLGGAVAESSPLRAPPAPQEKPAPAAPAVFAPARPAPGVDELINGSLEELIRTAENIQAEHVRAERRAHNGSGANGSGAKSVPAPRRTAPRAADTSLQDAIARIEAAARAAAKGSRTE
jgi:branched-chain amino acid transport system ATP-binding protein